VAVGRAETVYGSGAVGRKFSGRAPAMRAEALNFLDFAHTHIHAAHPLANLRFLPNFCIKTNAKHSRMPLNYSDNESKVGKDKNGRDFNTLALPPPGASVSLVTMNN
jgi:hypothetical protein